MSVEGWIQIVWGYALVSYVIMAVLVAVDIGKRDLQPRDRVEVASAALFAPMALPVLAVVLAWLGVCYLFRRFNALRSRWLSW